MSIFAVSNISVQDQESYHRFWARFEKLVVRFGGEILSADANPAVAEGTWEKGIALIVAFPSVEAFKSWTDSLEYKKIITDRNNSASFSTVLVDEYKSPSIDAENGTGAERGKYFLRADEKLQISFFASMLLMFIMFAISVVRSDNITFTQALSEFDWQLAMLVTAIFMIVVNAISRRKYQYV